MLAAQAAVALDNARWAEGLEREVAQRTEELQASNAQLAQRADELAVINSIQQGIAGALSFQAIVDLVGDKLREVLKVRDIGICWLDHEREHLKFLYTYEHGARLALPDLPFPDSARRFIRTRAAELYGTAAEQVAAGVGAVEGTDQSKSCVAVPIVGSDRVLGLLSLEDYEREHAYGESELRLLQTVAASMGIALENARLFDETQRLLKETEQRNAELAVINTVQRGIAAQLEFQGVIDLVGDQLHAVFRDVGASVMMSLLDEAQGLVRYRYARRADGTREDYATIPYRPEHPAQQAIHRHETVHARDQAAANRWGFWSLGDGQAPSHPCSILAVGVFGSRARLGAITLTADRNHAFSDSLVRLLETIASSMGVALENARLFEETQRRERESSALSEVGRDLSSTLDPAPLMDRIAAHAKELLAAADSAIFLPAADGKSYRAIVAHGASAEALRATAIVRGEGIIGRLIDSGQPELINDTHADPRAVQVAGTTTQDGERMMVVPLLSGEDVEGAMVVWRTGGAPFDSQDLAFLVGLSRHAAVALHNAKLFDETRQALERQTATAEILKVIAASPADEQPVFDAIVSSAARLFGRKAALRTVDGDGLRRRARSYVPVEGEFHGPEVEPLGPGSIVGRAVLEGRPLQWTDTLVEGAAAYGLERARSLAFRSIASAPLMSGGRAIGVVSVSSPEPGAMSEQQMALLATFADQAVIAIQNARLFNETQDSLERQTATTEVLRVISESPTDVGPVFRAIAEAALRLCRATSAVVATYDGKLLHVGNVASTTEGGAEAIRALFPRPPSGDNGATRAVLTGARVEIPDVLADAGYRTAELSLQSGFRSVLAVPLLRDGQPIGVISLGRPEPGAFPDALVALLEAFADQAVIAIENVRLFNETREALQRQTAMAAVLSVLGTSMTDAQPVFDAIIDNCSELFRGSRVVLFLREGDQFRGHASNGTLTGIARPIDRDSAVGACLARHAADPLARPGAGGGAVPQRAPDGAEGRLPLGALLAAAARRPGDRGARRAATGEARLRRQGHRPAEDLYRTGRHRHRERAAVQRDAGGAGPPDRQRRHPARHQPFAHRRAAGVRCHRHHRGQAPGLRPRHRPDLQWRHLLAEGAGHSGRPDAGAGLDGDAD